MKIMRRNAIGFFVCILCMAGVKGDSSPYSIAKKIEENTCPAASFVYNSRYAELCKGMLYHSSNMELQKNNTDEFLCLGVFDLSKKICYLTSEANVQYDKLNVPNNVTLFDSELDTFRTKLNVVDYLCKMMQRNHSVTNDDIKSEVLQLTETLKSINKCKRICTDLNGIVNSLCIILGWADPIFGVYDASIKLESAGHTTNMLIKPNLDTYETENVEYSTKKAKTKSTLNENNSTELTTEKKFNPLSHENLSGEQTDVNASELITTADSRSSNKTSSVNKTIASSTHAQIEENTAAKPPASIISFDESRSNMKNLQHASNLSDSTTLHEAKQQEVKKVLETDVNKHSGDMGYEHKKEPDIDEIDKNAKTFESGIISKNTQDHEYMPNEENNSPYDLDDTDIANDIDGNANQLPDPSEQREVLPHYSRIRHEDDSHFFAYLMVLSLFFIGGYVGYHNKQKILAILLEGRRSRGNRNRRRPSTASYRKLDCTLEEAVTSQCNSNVTHIIY